MAMSKQDYTAQGNTSFLDGLPPIENPTSWQEKAFMVGYNEARNRVEPRMAELGISEPANFQAQALPNVLKPYPDDLDVSFALGGVLRAIGKEQGVQTEMTQASVVKRVLVADDAIIAKSVVSSLLGDIVNAQSSIVKDFAELEYMPRPVIEHLRILAAEQHVAMKANNPKRIVRLCNKVASITKKYMVRGGVL